MRMKSSDFLFSAPLLHGGTEEQSFFTPLTFVGLWSSYVYFFLILSLKKQSEEHWCP